MSRVCFELSGKKSESAKLPFQSMKKKASRITVDMEQSMKKAVDCKKEPIDAGIVKEKMPELTRRFDESNEALKYKLHDRTHLVEHRKSQINKTLVNDSLKHHRGVDVNSQLLQRDIQRKILDQRRREHSLSDGPDCVKKFKLSGDDVETKLTERSHVEYQKKVNSGEIQEHYDRTRQTSDSSCLQLLERHLSTGERVGLKSDMDVKTEAEAAGSRTDVDRCRDSARRHVTRALYRALSSRSVSSRSHSND